MADRGMYLSGGCDEQTLNGGDELLPILAYSGFPCTCMTFNLMVLILGTPYMR